MKKQNLEEVLDILSPRQREIIELRAENYSYKEIAEKLEISVETVRHQIYLLRKKL